MSLELEVKSKLGTQGDSSACKDISPREKEEGKERARKGLEHFSVLLKEPARDRAGQAREEGETRSVWHPFPGSSYRGCTLAVLRPLHVVGSCP